MAYISKHFKKSFEVYKRNFVPIILSVLLIGIIYGLFFGLSIFALFGPKGVNTIAESYMMSGEFTDFESQEFSEFLNLQNVGLFLLFVILGGIIAIFLQAGFWGVCFHGIKKRVTMKTFFTTIRKRGISYFLANILVGVIVLTILILLFRVCIVLYFFSPILSTIVLLLGILMITPFLWFGILIIFPFFVLCYPAIISGKKILVSLAESLSLGKKYFSSLMLFFIVIILLSIIVYIPSIIFSYAELFLIYPTAYIILVFLGHIIIYFLISPLFTLVICSFYIDVKQKPEKIKRQKRTIKKQKGKRK